MTEQQNTEDKNNSKTSQENSRLFWIQVAAVLLLGIGLLWLAFSYILPNEPPVYQTSKADMKSLIILINQ